jgi:hypothetical protein
MEEEMSYSRRLIDPSTLSIENPKEVYSIFTPLGENSILHTLKDRAKHLKIVSENFATQGNTLVSRLDLYDSEIAFEIQQKIERIPFIIGLIGTILAVIAIIQQAFF